MKTTSTWRETGDGGRVEVATVELEGRSFTSLGAAVTPARAAGYPRFAFEGRCERVGAVGVLETFEGVQIGTCRVVAAWPVRSWVGGTMYQIEAVIGGRVYTGRGFGHGMLWRGRAKVGR